MLGSIKLTNACQLDSPRKQNSKFIYGLKYQKRHKKYYVRKVYVLYYILYIDKNKY